MSVKSHFRTLDSQRRFHVLVALRLFETAGQQKFAGILSRLGAQNEWDIQLLRTQDELTVAVLDKAETQGLDGVIVSIAHDVAVFKRLAALRCPLIVMGLDPAELRSRRRNLVVLHDSASDIARKALAHFTAAGKYQSFAFVHNRRRIGWSTLREQAFVKAARKPVQILPPTNTPRDRSKIANFLKRLERPSAILAANDSRAAEVLAVAAELKFRVPEDLSILGIDNDPFVCTSTKPTISSIEPDFFAEGRAAAHFLDKMMRARTPMSTRHIEIDVKRVIPRESTSRLLSAQALIDRAREFINAHATRGITPQDVATHLHVSRQLLDLRFHESSKGTVGEHITRRKLAEVKRLLTQTTTPISHITELCGFANENALKNLFKRTTGLSMRDWRRTNLRKTPKSHDSIESGFTGLSGFRGGGQSCLILTQRHRGTESLTGED